MIPIELGAERPGGRIGAIFRTWLSLLPRRAAVISRLKRIRVAQPPKKVYAARLSIKDHLMA